MILLMDLVRALLVLLETDVKLLAKTEPGDRIVKTYAVA